MVKIKSAQGSSQGAVVDYQIHSMDTAFVIFKLLF